MFSFQELLMKFPLVELIKVYQFIVFLLFSDFGIRYLSSYQP